jgi:hypothetical protein
MDDEKRNEAPSLRDDDGNGISSDRSGINPTTEREGAGPEGPSTNLISGDLQAQQAQVQAQGSKIESRRGTPGEANPAREETESYIEGTISTADFLRARGSREAQLPGALEDRDKGLAGRPPHHGSLTPPIGGIKSEADLYDAEEKHTMHEEPGMHVFAPDMLNIPSEEREENDQKE